jgi:hypothetical protein
MHARHDPGVELPPQAVTNAGFPYDDKLTAARRFLASRGIREVRPLYGAARVRFSTPPPAESAGARAQARWFPDTRCA